MTDVQQAVPVAQEYPATAIGALTGHQRQIDTDGTFVGISRQALDELIAWAETHRLASHPCKSGEGAGEREANLEAQRQAIEASARIADIHAEQTDTPDDFTRGYEIAASKIASSIRKLAPNESLALTPDATQTREAELVAAGERLLLAMTTRALRGRDHVPSMRDEQDAASALRAALNARGGA